MNGRSGGVQVRGGEARGSSGAGRLRWLAVGLCLALTACRGPAPVVQQETKQTAPPEKPLTLEDAHAFYAAQPRHLRPVPYTPVPAGLPDLRAETCGSCHAEIYREWQVSTHARAFLDDPQFLAELEKPGQDGGDVKWMCMNCHTPLENQLPRLVAGLQDGRVDRPRYVENPRFDAALQRDAITCATCHVRDGVVVGPYGDSKAPHPVRSAPELRAAETCTQCHQARASFDQIALACVFDTGDELAQGPYGAQGLTCQGCHMPEVERPIAPGGPVRKTRRHWFGGSLIPKQPRFEAELEPLRKVYPDGLAVRWIDPPASIRAGEAVRLGLELENARAGHRLPTGDPERFILVHAEAIDAGGRVLAALEERIGTRFQWWPTVKKLADNRLLPQEKRRLELAFTAPPAGKVTLRLRASKWRISPENLKYHRLEGKTVPGRTFVDEARTVTVR